MNVYDMNKKQLNNLVKNLNKEEVIKLLQKYDIPYKKYLSPKVLKKDFIEEIWITGVYKRIGQV